MDSIFRGADNFDTNTHTLLQTHSKVFRNLVSQTITTTPSVVGGISTTITAKRSNSKFLVYVRWFGEVNGAWDVVFNIRLDGVNRNASIYGSGEGYGLTMPRQSYLTGDDYSSTPETVEAMILIAPGKSAGAVLTFDITAVSGGSRTLWTNRCNGIVNYGHEVGTSEIIIQEVTA